MVLPHIGVRTVGARVMMAWRGGRASSRALNDAIPFLEQAQLVNLLQVNPPHEHDQDERKLRTYLQYHNIKVTADKLTADDVSIGDIILNRACDQGIDLIVLGVFARTRFGALGLGPVSKYLLEHMTVPILMSR
jgi:nucleotide-binding universal stress UspA family protein